MRRSLILAAMAASAGMAVWCGSASAQGVGVEFYAGPPAAYDRYDDYPAYREYRYRPRGYGYYSERDLRKPEHYRPGSNRWWKEMDRDGRGGQQ